MSVICLKCGNEMPNRDNVYGTVCTRCNAFIEPSKKPQIIEDAENRLREQQNFIREYLRRNITGDTNGN